MNKEREKQILQKILLEKKVTVKELAKELYSSEPSIRRDLENLEKQNLVKRVHGGAILENSAVAKVTIPFQIRELEQHSAKEIMAQKASQLIRSNDVVFLDASSSAFYIIPFLARKNNLTVITSGIKSLMKLSEYGNEIDVLCTGGRMINTSLSLIGDDAYSTINKYNADIFFFSCRGLTLDGKLTDDSELENNIRKQMILHSKKSYLLCDSTKLDKTYFHTLCSAKNISGIISDKPLPESLNKFELKFDND